MNFDDLVEQKLVQIRPHDTYDYTLYKYHRKVFYKNLFPTDERLRFARGIVLDSKGCIIVRPFYKFYNYHENGAGEDWNMTDPVIATRKWNGFMLSVTPLPNGDILFTTTGTFDSDYSKLGERYVRNQIDMESLRLGLTYIFEICAAEDPHIIDEKMGVYLIGINRNHLYTKDEFSKIDYPNQPIAFSSSDWEIMVQSYQVFAEYMNAYPLEYIRCEFGELLELNATAKHEGFMVYNQNNVAVDESVIKLKSPYYLVTKLLARHSLHKDHKVNFGKLHNIINEEYYPLLKHLKNYPDFFDLKEQDRIQYIRNYFGDQSCN